MINKLKYKRLFLVFALILTLFVSSSVAFAHAFAQTSSESTSTGAITAQTSKACRWHIKTYVIWELGRTYSKVEWTKNPCGYTIQDRTLCTNGQGEGWSYSPSTKKLNNWVRASCGFGDGILEADYNINNGKWQQYWH